MDGPLGADSRDQHSRSPLDLLGSSVQLELWGKCQSTETFQEIRAWLIEKHGLRVCLSTLSSWRRRHLAENPMRVGGVTFSIEAPAAHFSAGKVKPPSTGEAAQP